MTTSIDDVKRLTRPGHDRECAHAMLYQASKRSKIMPLDDIQDLHLLRIGYSAGLASKNAVNPDEVAVRAEEDKKDHRLGLQEGLALGALIGALLVGLVMWLLG